MHPDLRQVLNHDAVLRQTLRRLPRYAAPSGMTARLRAVAVQDRIHRQRPRPWRQAWDEVCNRAHLAFQNFLRPLAVPALGGVFSAVTLFNLWVVPAYPVQQKPGLDVRTQLNTEASFKGALVTSGANGSFAVDLLVDEQGRMAEYTIVNEGYTPNETELRNLLNLLTLSKFQPATQFGKPKMSKFRLQFFEVKG